VANNKKSGVQVVSTGPKRLLSFETARMIKPGEELLKICLASPSFGSRPAEHHALFSYHTGVPIPYGSGTIANGAIRHSCPNC
jgi:hypothetical protein